MMTRLAGLIVAGGMILAGASTADAQISVQLGNPYSGRGITIGNPAYSGYGYSPYSNYGYAAPVTSYYSSGYTGYAAPATTYYSSGYTGYAVPSYGYSGYNYGRGYGYGGYYGGGRGYGRGMGLGRIFR